MSSSYSFSLLTLLVILPAMLKTASSVQIKFYSKCSGHDCFSTFRPATWAFKNLTLMFSPGIHKMPSSTMSFHRLGYLELKPMSPNIPTVILCEPTSQRYGRTSSYNLAINGTAHVRISGMHFSGCNIEFSYVNKTVVENAEFISGSRGAIKWIHSFNVTIDKSIFRKNTCSRYYSIITFLSTAGVTIANTNFIDNNLMYNPIIGSFNSRDISIVDSMFVNNTGALVSFSSTFKIVMSNFDVINNHNDYSYAIHLSDCRNLTMDKFTFRNNTGSHQITTSSTAGIVITKANFTNNHLQSGSKVISLRNSRNIIIVKSSFANNVAFSVNKNRLPSYVHYIELSSCHEVAIDKSSFYNNTLSSHGSMLKMSSTIGIKVTRSNFTNNNISSSHSEAIRSEYSYGSIGCSNFYNNKVGSYGGIVKIGHRTFLSISNSVFGNNTVNSHGGLVFLPSYQSEVVIIGSVFNNNKIRGSHGGMIALNNYQSSATILASKFIGTDTFMYSRSKDVMIDCSVFVNSTITTSVIHNAGLCKKYGTINSAECANTACNLKDCQPPIADISLEQSEYAVDEEIGKLNRALQVCVIATNLLFGVKLKVGLNNGSAIENLDYTIDNPDLKDLEFVRKPGTQKKCTYIRILEDSINEGTEKFSLNISSVNPYITFDIQNATVFIVDGAEKTPIPTSIPTTSISFQPTTPTVTDKPRTPTVTDKPRTPTVTGKPRTPIHGVSVAQGPSKTAIVECGPLRRYVNFTSECTDHKNLMSAIAQSFGGLTRLQEHNIAVLQTKSKQNGDYIDLLPTAAAIDNNTVVKVVTYDGFSCKPKST